MPAVTEMVTTGAVIHATFTLSGLPTPEEQPFGLIGAASGRTWDLAHWPAGSFAEVNLKCRLPPAIGYRTT